MQPSTMTEWLPIVVGLLTVSCFHYEVSGASESCILQCGEQLQTCSCHASCEGLGSCCRDYHEYCIRIIPHSGTLMGGKDFIVLNVTFGANSTVVCRFSNETNTKGYIDQDGHAHCISPLLFETGRIPFAVSVDRDNNFTRLGTWLAVHHSKASVDEKSTLTESKKWQYYGTPGYDGTLTLTWNLNSLPHKDIRIEVWGYGEKGTPYNDTWSAHWTYLYTLALSYPNNGNFTFTPTPAQQSYNQWEVGMLRIVPSDEPLGERNVHAIWSPVHALAWHLEESFRNNSAAWAYKKCLTWREAEKTVLPNFLKETPDCPCTLAQSRADTGRYHTDYGCDIEKGSVCTYHPGAVHCVRSIQPSAEYAAGQQCCYDSTGAQVLTFDSVGGSTPDRGHDWGSPPYRKPPRIPGFSHWLYDVITFYYCCLWSDSCQYYLELRPSSDCRTYKPPKAASAFGDPHFVTFDGANYTFNGKGEYTLVSSSHWSLTIQGRTKPFNVSKSVTGSTNNSDINVTSFSSVAMQENRSDVIEVRLKDGTNQELQTLLNQEEISFEEQSWMDLKGVFVYSSGISNVTVMFPSGAGVEVRGREGFLAITVLLPEEFINQTQGLLGVMNNNPVDDFTFRNGTVLPADATAEELFQFGADWAVINESSRFTYDSENLINDYKLKHDPSFLPIFSFEKIPSDLIRALCGDDKFCTFDGLASEDQIIAKATKISYLSHSELVKNLQAEVSCGWLAPPENGTKTGTTYLAGSVMLFNCNLGFILNGTQRRTCLPNGTWSGDPVHCLVGDNGSCASQCGKKLQQCSCHVTCENLKTCCPDYRNFCIRISPNSGLIMGGRDFIVLNVTFVGGSDVKCRFKGEIITQGYIDKDGSAHCISPLLYETGRVPFEISADGGGSYPYSGTWLSVHPGKVKETEKCTLVNETKWQYYGTPNVDGTLTVQWDSTTFANHAVNIEVWGYEETGEPYSSSWTGSWRYLYSLVRGYSNNGSFTFYPQPAKPENSVFEFGSLRITSSQHKEGMSDVHSLWSVDHAMAWHLGENFRRDSAAWAQEKCFKWHQNELTLPDFLPEIIDCPCTMAQSIADTGRFHPDYGCDIASGSVCTYHPGAVHCVRGIYGSPKYAAGQQCCYNSRGFQVLTSDSVGGSTPDRGHDWGSPPYVKPPRVPGFSHWLYDVISFYYCCLWSDNCQKYLQLRPSSDCRTYRPPKVASAFGDPHFITFDGASFTFNGKGEYVLVISQYKLLNIQGRTQAPLFPNGSIVPATGLCSVAMREGESDVVEVRLAASSEKVEILLNNEVVNFDRSWIDLKGVFIFSGTNQNVSIMFPSGAGVEVRGKGPFLSVTVLLPETFMNQTQGLLGVMNHNPKDDFMFRNGTLLPSNASPLMLFQLGADWAISNSSTLFTYDSEFLIKNYKTKHDPDFRPHFSVLEDPLDPLKEPVNQMCGLDNFCRFDALTTRELAAGNATKFSHEVHKSFVESLQPVVSCGWIGPPANGKKVGSSYLTGSEVTFSCNKGYILIGPSSRACQMDGTWSGHLSQCVADNTIGIVLGSLFGFLTLLVLILLIVLHERKRIKKKEMNVPSVTYQPSNDL
ncbi:hypothetical protein GDO86_002111 [Hymenochirus boettgeri]|uniref:Sushi domain-containing protein 2 n=1 Tax=Hymenochirus boettgeri TaxID=247094 RepID=A0A8T2KLG1_9PIPI|nr:hypothetical protein GDO86_002111 [Hymenochirus boettgeri]